MLWYRQVICFWRYFLIIAVTSINNNLFNSFKSILIYLLLCFRYTGSLFNKAYKNDLEEEDLYEVIRCCASKECGDELEKTWLLEKKNKQSVSVTRLLWKRFGLKYFLFGMIELIWKVLIR